MKKIIIFFLLVFVVSSLSWADDSDDSQFKKQEEMFKVNEILFKNADKEGCDYANNKAYSVNQIMVNESWRLYHQCWKRSMNKEIDKRLIPLKQTDIHEFHKEMDLQKEFNQVVKLVCGRDCQAGTLAGTPNFSCEVAAFQYRTKIAEKIFKHELTVPVYEKVENRYKDKEKFTKYFKEFATKLCALPPDIWKNQTKPIDCETKAYEELDHLTFTDDVCDLS